LRERPQDSFSNKAIWTRHIKRLSIPVGSINAEGYLKIYFYGKYYSGHRIAWFIHYGEWVPYPIFEIDHINGVKNDNRIVNLRKVTKSQNQRHGKEYCNSKSGVRGVYWLSSKSRWLAKIWDGPHHRYIGSFRTLEEAKAARRRVENELGYTRYEDVKI